VDIDQAQVAADFVTARILFEEYARSLGIDLSFQGFEVELSSLQSMYSPPCGCLLLARRGADTLGCIGVRNLSGRSCEMKRLYVRDAARGSGLGRQLALRAINIARSLGYQRMCLDTLADMSAARGLYRALGFRDIEPYYQTPLAGTSFMALDLPP
jgi:ribosomal protein S18 acetylase RimI-like enzyme